MKNYGVVLNKIRTDKKISLRQAAKLTQRSIGWLSEEENGKDRAAISEKEFKRIAASYGAETELRKYQLIVARLTNYQEQKVWFEGAIYKHLRLKKGLSLIEAALLLEFSKSHLSNIEASRKQVSTELRTKILSTYGYKSSSFRNYTSKEERTKGIPIELRLKALIRTLNQNTLEQLFTYAQQLKVSA